jgi:hypothetical protein
MPSKKKSSTKKGTKPRRVRLANAKPASRMVQVPAARSRVNTARPASIKSTNNQVCVKHRELVALLDAGDTPFPLSIYRINPANASLFPWLSQMSMQWETYKFKSLRFAYVSNSSTANNGSLTMSLDYDVLDPPPQNIQAMITMPNAVSGPLWAGPAGMLVYRANPQNLSKMKSYFIADSVPTGADAKTYDVGSFFLSAVSGTGSVIPRVGQLWVEYEVDFYTPQLPQSQSNATETFYKVGGTFPATPQVIQIPILGNSSNIYSKNEFQRDTLVSQFNTIFNGLATAFLLNWVRPVIISSVNALFMKVYLWLSTAGPPNDEASAPSLILNVGYPVPSGVGSAQNMITDTQWFLYPAVTSKLNNAGYFECEFYIDNAALAALPAFPKSIEDVWFEPAYVGSTNSVPTSVQIDTFSVPGPLLTIQKSLSVARYQQMVDDSIASAMNQSIITVADGAIASFFESATFAGTGITYPTINPTILETANYIPGYYYLYHYIEHPTLLTTPALVLANAGSTIAVFTLLAQMATTTQYFAWYSILIGADTDVVSLELDSTTFTGTADATITIVPLLP